MAEERTNTEKGGGRQWEKEELFFYVAFNETKVLEWGLFKCPKAPNAKASKGPYRDLI